MKLKNLLPLIGIAIFIYIVTNIGVAKIINSFSGIKLTYIFLALILLVAEITMLTFKWDVILKRQNFRLDFLYLIKIYLIGIFYGFITPSRAGSLMRASYLKKKTNRPVIECGSSIVLERILDFLVIFIMSIIGALLLIEYLPGLFSKLIWVFVGFIVLSSFFLSKGRSEFVLKLIHKFLIPSRLKNKVKDSFNSFYNSLLRPKELVYPIILTIATWVLVYSYSFLIAKAFMIDIPYFYFIMIFPISTIIAMIPITVGGIGTREASLIMLFSLFGIAPAKILSMSIVNLIIGGCIPALLGFTLSLRK